MKAQKLIGGIRVAVAAALLGSIIWQITDRLAHDLFRPAEYFAYFSIQGSMICAVVLSVTGWRAIQGLPETKLLYLTRLATAVYVTVISVAYNALLRGGAGDIRDAGYQWPVPPNEMIHVYGPIFMVLDLLFVAGFKLAKLRSAFWVVLYPVAWLAFSVARGNFDGWWAYWFLDPTDKGGVPQMLGYIFGICALMIALGFIFAALSKALRRIQIG